MSPIKAVIFDFGGVLCFHPTAEQIAQAAQTARVSVADFERALWTNRLEYDAGRIEPGAYWQEVAELAGSPIENAGRALEHLDVEFWSRFDERMLAWVRLLRGHGIATAVLSNLPRPLGEALKRSGASPLRADGSNERAGFLEHFDHVTFSYELGLVKPERAIYEHAIGGLGVSGGEALFLDDRPRNIEGAIHAGLQAVLYTNWEEFVACDSAGRFGLPLPQTNDLVSNSPQDGARGLLTRLQ